jgi:creatinine amidohydrolase/Fe(II)-dependent formamide hydrolase-like protein
MCMYSIEGGIRHTLCTFNRPCVLACPRTGERGLYIAFGVMESHGPHMPLGTDMIIARTIAAEAAKLEPAVIFPDYYIGQLAGAQHIPGNVCIKHDVLLSVLDGVCREIGQSGFQMIIIQNAHGGNPFLIKYFHSKHAAVCQ